MKWSEWVNLGMGVWGGGGVTKTCHRNKSLCRVTDEEVKGGADAFNARLVSVQLRCIRMIYSSLES